MMQFSEPFHRKSMLLQFTTDISIRTATSDRPTQNRRIDSGFVFFFHLAISDGFLYYAGLCKFRTVYDD